MDVDYNLSPSLSLSLSLYLFDNSNENARLDVYSFTGSHSVPSLNDRYTRTSGKHRRVGTVAIVVSFRVYVFVRVVESASASVRPVRVCGCTRMIRTYVGTDGRSGRTETVVAARTEK